MKTPDNAFLPIFIVALNSFRSCTPFPRSYKQKENFIFIIIFVIPIFTGFLFPTTLTRFTGITVLFTGSQ
jgi:hypothetical protein